MAERRFHEFRIDEKTIASFECAVCRVEESLLPAYKAVVERGTLEGSAEERLNLNSFIAFQFARTRARRDQFEDLRAQLDAHLGNEAVEGLGLSPKTDSERVIQHLRFMEEATPGFVGAMADKDLALMKAPAGRSFYLSDNPVVLHNDEAARGLYGNLGLAVKGIQIYLPLSADLMLCAWCPTLIGGLRERHASDKRRLASVMLAPFIGTVSADNDDLQSMLETLRPAMDRAETWLKSIDQGTPFLLNTDNMDFHNSLQVVSATQHIVCKHADFSLAARFMDQNPENKGYRFRVV